MVVSLCKFKFSDNTKYYEKPLTAVTLFTEKCFKQAIVVVCLCKLQDRAYSHADA